MSDAIATQSVSAFLHALAEGTPAPAGGSASAVTAATSAALAAMIARVMARRSADPRWTATAAIADDVRRSALALADRDVEVYRRVMDARSRHDTDCASALRDALRQAADVPLSVARATHRVLELCDVLAADVPRVIASDVRVAAALARAAVESAVETARANLTELIPDAASGETARANVAELTGEVVPGRAVRAAVAERAGDVAFAEAARRELDALESTATRLAQRVAAAIGRSR